VINAAGPLTRLGGMPLHPDVLAAMSAVAQQCVPMELLQEKAGRYLAEVTGAEAGYVTSGAAAGLALAAAACIARLDPAAMDRLPETSGLRNEIVIQRQHLNAYTRALRLAGARLVEVGYVGYPGQGITWPWQIEAAITERTAAIAYAAQPDPRSVGAVPLEEVVAVARRHGLPVIVDAAAALPPVENLRRFVAAGADLVAFSGGKAIGGPQATGILVGRAELIDSVALQHQDMDVFPETWAWRERFLKSGRLPGPPHHGLGRAMKVGKEEIAGLVAALQRFLALDQDAERQRQVIQLRSIIDAVSGLPVVRSTELRDDPEDGWPVAVVRLDEGALGRRAEDVVNELLGGDPAIAVSQAFLHQRGIGFSASTLRAGEAELVAERLQQVLGAR
jgi:L-seryl-tRNA(Ser) seleniumtransferase